MTLAMWAGAALIVLGGALQGTFAVPMKYARGWKHENIWLVFCLSGMVLFPWLLTYGVAPRLGEVYASTPAKTLMAIVIFGLLWGVGATLTGVGLSMVGIGLGLAVILGISASVGSMVPLLVLTPEKLFSAQGRWYLLGTLIMFAGIAGVAVAGSLREKAAGQAGRGSSLAAGLLVCIAAGVLSSALNFSFAFGTEAIEAARRMGASSVWAANVVAAPATTGGFLANLLYCAHRMRKNGSLRCYSLPGTAGHWALGAMMGLFWYGGLASYGMGIDRMGEFGTVAGWPMFMGAIIVASNAAGLITGEWKGAGGRARSWLFAGIGVILVALLVLSMAQR